MPSRGRALLLALALLGAGLAAAAAVPAESGGRCAGGACGTAGDEEEGLVVGFYYGWYGNPETDGAWLHWNHSRIRHWREDTAARYPTHAHVPPHDHGAAYRPLRGLYSSKDAAVLDSQVAELHAAGVRVVSFSWWGRPGLPESVDGEGVPTDGALWPLLRAAERHGGVRVSFHLEPYHGRTPASVREDLAYLHREYGASPAVFRDARRGGRPLFFVYDSYHNPAAEWRRLLAPDGDLTVRGTELDADFVSLYLERKDRPFVEGAGFDGVYTYFASTAFTGGANPSGWPDLAGWAASRGLLFVPCVGPGYDDETIRPWNAANTRPREGGQYYERYWSAAAGLDPPPHAVGITSYNEWGEGTQIEPAVPYASPAADGRRSADYGEGGPGLYMDATARWAAELRRRYRAARAGPE